MIFSTVPRSPCTGRPYGCSGPNASIGRTRAASALASRSCCAIASSSRFFSRATSGSGNVGVLHDVRDDRERGRQVALQHVEADARALAAGAARRASCRGRASASSICSALRVFVPRSIDGRRQLRDAGLAGRVGHGAGSRHQRHVQLRQIVALDDQHLEAVLELRRLHRGRDERPIRAERRLLRSVERHRVRGARRLLGMEADHGAVRRVRATRRRRRAPRPA